MPSSKTQATSFEGGPEVSVRALKGVGPEKEKRLAELGIYSVADLLYHFPRRYEERFPVKNISEISFEGKECVVGRITGRSLAHYGGKTAVFKAVIAENKNVLSAIFYHQSYLLPVFKPGAYIVLYGQAEKKGRRVEMVHPEYEIFTSEPVPTAHHGRWVPIYSLTENLSQKSLRQILFDVIHRDGVAVGDFLPESLRKRLRWTTLSQAIQNVHFPINEVSRIRACRRLVFDEFFLMQLFVEAKRQRLRSPNPELLHDNSNVSMEDFISLLPYELTPGQHQATEDVLRDLRQGHVMNRLIHGDVGSGKTAVAAAGLFFTVEHGFQGALMAPTEILAQQLFYQMVQFLEPHGIRVGYLSQGAPEHAKNKVKEDLVSGSLQVVVGTHALLESDVLFHRLGLAVVDEQHKFGVEQREMLRRKSGKPVHFLAMTATPIPRSLAMTLYGTMDLSAMPDRPKGRQDIRTLLFHSREKLSIFRWIESRVAAGEQAFVVCPRLDSEKNDALQTAMNQQAWLAKEFPRCRVGLLHGRMKADQKNNIMTHFRDKKIDILVCTVIVEVGVDVPNATCMVIENAEQFGLAQLHQLRGRVGRGSGESYCILLSGSDSEDARDRLGMFVETDSGFDIAQQDLERRGAGEIHGRRQHGLMKFRLGDPLIDADLLALAKTEARKLVESDPSLILAEHRGLKERLEKYYGKSADPLSVG